jgi:hypothetical protein
LSVFANLLREFREEKYQGIELGRTSLKRMRRGFPPLLTIASDDILIMPCHVLAVTKPYTAAALGITRAMNERAPDECNKTPPVTASATPEAMHAAESHLLSVFLAIISGTTERPTTPNENTTEDVINRPAA